MKYSRENLMLPEELADNFELSTDTLADWRSQKTGPTYMKIANKIWYTKSSVDSWAEAQVMETNNGNKKTKREVELSLQIRREDLCTNNRLGRHRTKQ